jgi:hypothetical protein
VPQKRPTESKSSEPFVDSSRYKELWFEDGNVVINCRGSVSFRVYRGILSWHSEVFRDTFLIGQPSEDGTEKGVPTVNVTDSADGMFIFLKKMFLPQ